MTDKQQPDGNKLIAERRQKLDALRERGEAFPNDFRRNALADELAAAMNSDAATTNDHASDTAHRDPFEPGHR